MSDFEMPESGVPDIASPVYSDTDVKGAAACATPITDVESLSRTLGNITLMYPNNEMSQSTPTGIFIPETPRSTYKPPENFNDSGDESTPSGSSRDKLNEFLSSRDISPIRSKLTTAWHLTKERTKRHYTRKARQAVHAVLDEVSPGDADSLWEALKTSRSVPSQFPLTVKDQADATLIEALAECYNNANHWSTRRQILSIMADKVSFKVLKRWIPDLTRYRFNIAKHHQLLHGRGAAMQTAQHIRMYVAPGQLSHFLNFITSAHIIQDLPFGERKLKLSSNEELTIPNVIRTVIPAQIISQYEELCNEEGFKPMGRSTLYRILHVCSASIRKSLQGIDYVGAQGAKAFEELELAAEKLGDKCGLGMAWAKDKKEQLRVGKRYLKGDFKVHVSKSSTVPDHCRAYALSDPGDPDYTAACDHTHNESCDRFLLLSSVVTEIEDSLDKAECTVNEREELTFIVTQAKQNIDAWKAHLLRCSNQDECRLDILSGLDTSSILLVLDWAMKFLPRKFRESQADWFAKRGVPWHLAVAIRSNSREVEMMTFAHVFESATAQDSSAVLAILDDIFRQLKTVMTELQTIYLRHDNAGCYHCAQTLVTAPQIAKRHGFQISGIDFSDPQGGKGSCDRKAATIKSHMAKFLNSGHDIETAAQMKEAIESFGGVHGVSVKVCSPPSNPSSKSFKWEKVSFVSNLRYSQDGIRTWRAYNIGPGKCIPWTKFDIPEEWELPTMKASPLNGKVSANFVPVRPRRTSRQPSVAETADNSDSAGESDASSGAGQSRLFVCPEEGCVKTFMRHSSLIKHLDCGKHKRALEHETLYDKAMIEYATKLECGASKAPALREGSGSPLATTHLTMGWALKSSRSRRTKFSDKQKLYLNAKFQIGETTGKKADPSDVSKAMRTAKDSNGDRLFGTGDFLTSQQVSSYFSRLAAKRRVGDPNQPDSEDETPGADLQSELRNKVLSEVSIQHSHPIIYDSYNICDLVLNSKLSSFSVSMLRNICEAFGLDTSEITVRRKKPFVDLLSSLVQGCSCNGKG